MRNKEYFQKELAEIALSGCGVALMYGIPTKCSSGVSCLRCGFAIDGYTCVQALQEWAEAEYIEPATDPFGFNVNEKYFYINETGDVCSKIFCNDLTDYDFIQFGNACKDERYMVRRSKETELYNLLSNFAHKANEGWVPDWEDGDEQKYYVGYDNLNKNWYENSIIWCSISGAVYFKSEELAQRAIDEVVIPFERALDGSEENGDEK